MEQILEESIETFSKKFLEKSSRPIERNPTKVHDEFLEMSSKEIFKKIIMRSLENQFSHISIPVQDCFLKGPLEQFIENPLE